MDVEFRADGSIGVAHWLSVHDMRPAEVFLLQQVDGGVVVLRPRRWFRDLYGRSQEHVAWFVAHLRLKSLHDAE